MKVPRSKLFVPGGRLGELLRQTHPAAQVWVRVNAVERGLLVADLRCMHPAQVPIASRVFADRAGN